MICGIEFALFSVNFTTYPETLEKVLENNPVHAPRNTTPDSIRVAGYPDDPGAELAGKKSHQPALPRPQYQHQH